MASCHGVMSCRRVQAGLAGGVGWPLVAPAEPRRRRTTAVPPACCQLANERVQCASAVMGAVQDFRVQDYTLQLHPAQLLCWQQLGTRV